jgi:replicative DNA helicase
MNNNINSLISLNLEKISLGALFKYGIKLWADVSNSLTEECFSDADNLHKIIFLTIRKYLDQGKTFDKVLIANDIHSLGIKTHDIDIFEYCNILSTTQITLEGAIKTVEELVKLKICRELVDQSARVKNYILSNKDKDLKDIVSEVDKINNEKISSLYNANQSGFIDIFETMQSNIEEISNNPPDDSKFMLGPFPTINRIYGSLSRPGNITVVGSRSGVGKTGLGMYVNTYLALKYNLPILHLDFGEMSPSELQFRAAVMLTGGAVPYWAFEYGKWKSNEKWAKIVKEAFEKAKKIKFYYEDVSNMNTTQVISLIRRFSYNKVGRNNMFLTHYDYLKPLENTSRFTAEWQAMGYFMKDIKSFITNELQIPFWTSLQLNRSGITTNKSSKEVEDSEASFSISDRIQQQATHAFIMRNKTYDEIASFGPEYGNAKIIFVKNRHLGEDFEKAINLVKVNKKDYQKNYINMLIKSFCFEDKGDLNKMIEDFKEIHNVKNEEGDGELL